MNTIDETPAASMKAALTNFTVTPDSIASPNPAPITSGSGATSTGRSQRHSWRRRIAAVGSAAAIALGGLAFVTPAEAQDAGVQRPVVIQTASPTVAAQAETVQREDDTTDPA